MAFPVAGFTNKPTGVRISKSIPTTTFGLTLFTFALSFTRPPLTEDECNRDVSTVYFEALRPVLPSQRSELPFMQAVVITFIC
jgi:hypothetical protein